jgi:hypothetical protein
MGVLTADLYTEIVGPFVEAPFLSNGADTYYQGALVYIDTGGGVQALNAAADRFLGVILKQQTVAAAEEVSVMIWGHIWLPLAANIAAEDEGDPVGMDDATGSDNIADGQSMGPEGDVGLDEDDIFIGRILRVNSPRMLVAIGHQMSGHIAAATATNAWG